MTTGGVWQRPTGEDGGTLGSIGGGRRRLMAADDGEQRRRQRQRGGFIIIYLLWGGGEQHSRVSFPRIPTQSCTSSARSLSAPKSQDLRADKEGAERKKQKKQSCARCDIQQLEGETQDKSERVTSASRVTKLVPARAYKERTESKSRRNTVSQIFISASSLAASLRLLLLAGPGRRKFFLPSASKSQI